MTSDPLFSLDCPTAKVSKKYKDICRDTENYCEDIHITAANYWEDKIRLHWLTQQKARKIICHYSTRPFISLSFLSQFGGLLEGYQCLAADSFLGHELGGRSANYISAQIADTGILFRVLFLTFRSPLPLSSI